MEMDKSIMETVEVFRKILSIPMSMDRSPMKTIRKSLDSELNIRTNIPTKILKPPTPIQPKTRDTAIPKTTKSTTKTQLPTAKPEPTSTHWPTNAKTAPKAASTATPTKNAQCAMLAIPSKTRNGCPDVEMVSPNILKPVTMETGWMETGALTLARSNMAINVQVPHRIVRVLEAQPMETSI